MKQALAVVTNESQWKVLGEAYPDLSDLHIFCDNPRYYETLRNRNVVYTPLDDFFLKEQWAEVNEWGCSVVLDMVKLGAERQLFKSLNLASTLNLYLSYFLVQMGECAAYAEKILRQNAFTELVIFKSAYVAHYPYLEANYFLNYFLKHLAEEKGIHIRTLDVAPTKAVNPYRQSFTLKEKLVPYAKWIFKSFYGLLASSKRFKGVLVHGSLRHVSLLLEELRKRNRPVALYDFAFHLEQFRFAKKQGIPYWIPECFPKTNASGVRTKAQEYLDEMTLVFDQMAEAKGFMFRGQDCGPLIRRSILPGFRRYFEEVAAAEVLFESILQTADPSALVLDEDHALRGSHLAAYFELRRKKVYCVSHAINVVDFEVTPARRVFGQSTTFANSDYEKDMYTHRGWDGRRITVTGTPRYDRLLSLTRKKNINRRSSDPVKLLYCAASLFPHSPNLLGYLGYHITNVGDVQAPYFKKFIHGLEGQEVVVRIKPHNAESVVEWKKIAEQQKAKFSIEVLSHAEDMFRLLCESDAMVLAYWSTAMIETAIARTPIIYLNFDGHTDSDEVRKFLNQGYGFEVLNPVQLKERVRLLREKKWVIPESSVDDYYLGPRNGSAAARVCDILAAGL